MTVRYFKPILLTQFYFCLTTPVHAMLLVQDNKPIATIIVEKDAGEQIQKTALTLQYYIKMSTGAKLPITHATTNNINIHIGETSYVKQNHLNLSKLDQDGFVLQTLDNKNIAIVGGSNWGTEFGVYDFLERYLGIRWLMPTEIGTDIPKYSTLDITVTNIWQEPVYLSRSLSPINIMRDGPQDKWGRFNRARGRISFHHNLLNMFPVSKYGKSNPEFYPMIGGQHYIPSNDADFNWQPNFSAPNIVESAVQTIQNHFDKNPESSSYSLGMNDSRNWDQSDASKARRSNSKNYLNLENISDDYFTWANHVVEQVSEKYPNKWFGTLAYNENAEPPTKISINAQIVPFITYDRMRWSDPKLREAGHQLHERWAKASPSLGYYDYAYGISYLLPRVYFHGMQDYLSWGAAHQVKHYYAELYPNWGEGPKAWLLTRLLWNPSENVDELLNDWYVHFGGSEAAPKLKEFYAIWEKFWTVDIFKSRWNSDKGQYLPFNSSPSYLKDVTNNQLTHADRLMNQALILANSPQRKARVTKLYQMWSFYKASVIDYQAQYAIVPTKESSFFTQNNATPNKIQTITKTINHRQQLLESLKNDPLFTHSAQYINQYPNTAGTNWGEWLYPTKKKTPK